ITFFESKMSESDSHHPLIQDNSPSPAENTTPPTSDHAHTENTKPRDRAGQSANQKSMDFFTVTQIQTDFDGRAESTANLLRDRVHSLSKEWLAGMRADFIEIQELMDINSQIAQDFNDWVEAGAVDSLVHQEKSLRESLEEIHSLESQAADMNAQIINMQNNDSIGLVNFSRGTRSYDDQKLTFPSFEFAGFGDFRDEEDYRSIDRTRLPASQASEELCELILDEANACPDSLNFHPNGLNRSTHHSRSFTSTNIDSSTHNNEPAGKRRGNLATPRPITNHRISFVQLLFPSAHRAATPINQTIDVSDHNSIRTSSHLSISPSLSRPKLIRHLLFSTPDSSASTINHYHQQQQQHSQFKHHKSNTSHHPSTSQPSNSIHSLSRSSHNTHHHHHLSNPTPPLRVGLPLICVARAHHPNHPYQHYPFDSHLKQLVAIASRTEIRILELINQYHSFPIEATRRQPHTSFSPSHSRAETRPSFASRSFDSSTTFDDRLAIKTNAELGPSYGVSDLSWGYASTASHLATGCTNGSIVVWDINHPVAQDPIQRHRSLTLDHAHNRAINKIAFAGPTGHWIASGAQDSLIKIWVSIPSTPHPQSLHLCPPSSVFNCIVLGYPGGLKADYDAHYSHRSCPSVEMLYEIRFSPDRTANPFDLFVLTDSGTLSHFDLRQEKSCLTRRVAHASTGVGLDWLSDEYNSLLASAGADGIVKIWNMAERMLPGTAMRTLVVGRSISGMAWRPGYSTQLVITPTSAMADLEQRGYSDYERGPASAISSNYSDDMLLNKGVNVTGTSSGSDIASEYNHPGGGRHSEILLWDIRRQYVPEMIIRGRDGPASDMVWLSADLLLTTHKRTSAIVQHDIGQSQAKYADELPSQALAVSKNGSMCFSIGSNKKDSRSNIEDELGSAMVHSIDELQPAHEFEFLALNYKFEDLSFEAVCEHNANLCQGVGQPDLWQLWMAVKLWFTPSISAALIVAQDMALGYNANDERAVAMAMRRVLKEESSDEDETDSDQSGGDMESSCGRRSPSQDQTSRKNSTTGSRAWSGGTRSKREESQERSEVNSPLPKHDHAHGHRPKLSLSGLALPSVFDPGELLRGGQSLGRSSSATTPKAQMRSSFLSNVTSNASHEGSAEPGRRRPAPLRSLALDCDSPLSSPDTEGPRRSIAHRRTDKTPDGRLNPAWRRSMSKDRIAAKMHARGASFYELGSLIQAIGVSKLLSEKKGEDWKNQEERMSVELQMRESILKLVQQEVEVNGNVQLGVYIIGVLKVYHPAHESHEEEPNHNHHMAHPRNELRMIESELLEGRFKTWGRVYLKSLTRHPSLLVVISEIKKKFPCLISKQLEDQSLRILKLNPSCGNCAKILMNSVLPSHPLSSHELIKFEPLIWCLKCGHGIHSNCLKKLKTEWSTPATRSPSSVPVVKQDGRTHQSKNPVTDTSLDPPPGSRINHRHHQNELNRNPNSFSSTSTTATLAELHDPSSLTPSCSSVSRPFLQCPSGCGCIGCFYSF
ncbi:hypothetical protein PSTT_10768, partial [Puccinia striiformis]